MFGREGVRGFRLRDGVVRWRWLWSRLLALPVAFFIITFASFILFNGIPGHGPVDRACRHTVPPCSPEIRQNVERREGLDRPLLVQYGDWLENLVRWDLGRDTFTRLTVESRVQRGFSASAEIVLLTAAFGVVLALGLRAIAERAPAAVDVVAAAFGSVPVFALAVWVLVYPFEWWGYAPPLEGPYAIWEDPLLNLRLYLPLASLISVGAAFLAYTSIGARRVSLRAAANAGAISACTALSALVLVELVFGVRGDGVYYLQSVYFRQQDAAQAMLALAILVAFGIWLALGSGLPGVSTSRPLDLRAFVREPRTIVPLALVALFFLIGLLGPYVAPYDPKKIGAAPWETPSWSHPFGTDGFGRDLFSRGVAGARPPLLLVVSVLAFGFIPGMAAGAALRRCKAASLSFLRHAAAAAIHLPALWIALAVAVVNGHYDWHARLVVVLVGFVVALPVIDCGGGGTRTAYVRRILEHNGPGAIAAAAELAVIALTVEASIVFLGFGDITRDYWGADFSQARNAFPAHWPGLVLSIVPLMVTLFGFSWLAVTARRATADANATGRGT